MRTLLASIVAIAVGAAGDARAQTDPLAAWAGLWQGSCELAPPYLGASEFAASLKVEAAMGGVYTWQLTYEASGQMPRAVRHYEMVPVDAPKGHFALDEKNGLMLDTFVAGRAIHTFFTVSGLRIPGLYLLISDDELLLSLPSFEQMPARNTCMTGNATLCTESYRLKLAQSCRLRRTR